MINERNKETDRSGNLGDIQIITVCLMLERSGGSMHLDARVYYTKEGGR